MALNSLLRRILPALAVLAMCAAVRLPAQPQTGPLPHGGAPGLHQLGHLLRHTEYPPKGPAAEQPYAAVLFDATHLGAPMTLNRSWRVGITSDPDAATPQFDDSHWAIRDASDAIADVPDPTDSGDDPPDEQDHGPGHHHHHDFAWFRLHVKLAPGHGPLALLIQIPTSYGTSFPVGSDAPDATVFANGEEIRPSGPHGDTPERYASISRLYALNVAPNATDLTLVVRVLHIPYGFTAYTHFFATHTLLLGSPDDLNQTLTLWNHRTLFERLPKLANSFSLAILGAFLLALFFVQRGHREYLWLALYELVQAPISFIDVADKFAHLNNLLYAALFFQLEAISAYLYFEFLIEFLDLRERWGGKKGRFGRWSIHLLRWTAPVLALIAPSILLLAKSQLAIVLLVGAGFFCVFWFAAWLIFCLVVLIAATVRRNFEAGTLLIPLLLSFVGTLDPIFADSMGAWTGRNYQSPLTIQAGPIPIHFASFADFVGLLAIVLIIFVRFQRIHRDRERASSELAAARSMQELMIPLEKVKTPGFEIDSVYNPANEVGGDFFHIETTPEGGLLVVIGDVAGKGLQAAMNVSMLVGALRRGDELRPAKILEALNRVLVGSTSFTTCEAALFLPDGELVVASAGHLPPYLNSQEIALPGGLPLGVIDNATYDEIRLYLHPGDRVLFLSDGVVEARRSNGELFGFDRVHNLSNQSAFYIADAAKAFGQEDDITVLTVRRLVETAAAA